MLAEGEQAGLNLFQAINIIDSRRLCPEAFHISFYLIPLVQKVAASKLLTWSFCGLHMLCNLGMLVFSPLLLVFGPAAQAKLLHVITILHPL